MKAYNFIDFATQGYLLITGLIILFFHNDSVPQWPYLVAAHAGWIIGLHWMIVYHASVKAGKAFDLLRHFYPILLYAPLYNETGNLNQLFYAGTMDPAFYRLEQAVFGCQPAFLFMDRLPYLWVSEIFYAAYFSYYIMIAGCGLALFLKGRRYFAHYISVVSLVFYVCFIIYIFLPVVGPPIYYFEKGSFPMPEEFLKQVSAPPYPEAVTHGLFYKIMALIYKYCEAPGAAFPSSHVAVALTTLFFSFKYIPKIRFFHAIVVALLCGATVYCRYHFAIDIAAGAATALIAVPLADWLFKRSEKQN